MGDAPLLEARGLGKSYGALRACYGVDLAIGAGEVLGFIGANGAGKSTVIKMLSGSVGSDAGELLVDGEPTRFHRPEDALRRGIAAVQQEIVLAGDHSIAENVMLGQLPSRAGFVSRRALRRRVQELLAIVGLDRDPDTPTRLLPPAQQRLVMIAAALAREPRVLILDEPTAALPQEESVVVARVVRELAQRGTGVIYISHRLHEVAQLCSRVVAMRDGTVSGTLEGEGINHDAMLELVGASARLEHVEHEAPPARAAEAAVVLEVEGLTGMRVRDVSLQLRPGEIYGIAGLAGAGRSELLRLIYGVQRPTAGTVRFRGRELRGSARDSVAHGIGYIAEGRAASCLYGLDVRCNMTVSALSRHSRWRSLINRGWERAVVERFGRRMSLRGGAEAPIETLSGGNQQKVLVARWMVRDVELLILDEPTAGVDVKARAEIHDVLRELANRGMAVVVASVEADELVGLCDRVGVMVEGRLTTELSAPLREEPLIAAYYRHETGTGDRAA